MRLCTEIIKSLFIYQKILYGVLSMPKKLDEEGVRMEARELISGYEGVNTDWRDRKKLDMVGYAILAGYQMALYRALGSAGAGAMTQMLLGEIGDLILEVLGELEGSIDYNVAEPHELIADILKRLGIAKEVKVERLEDVEKHGRKLRRYKVEIRDSIFMPVHRVLVKRGLREYPLSPEAMITAAIVRKMLLEKNPRARVNVTTVLPQSEGEPLTIIVEEILPLHS